jgi:hypothetical protein
MARRLSKDAGPAGVSLLLILFFFFLVVLFLVLQQVPILGAFPFLLLFFVFFIRNDVEVYRMRLGYLELRLALRTTQNLAFFDFVFIDIDFRGTFRATDHSFILRIGFPKTGAARSATAFMQRIIYRGIRSQLPRRAPAVPEATSRRPVWRLWRHPANSLSGLLSAWAA